MQKSDLTIFIILHIRRFCMNIIFDFFNLNLDENKLFDRIFMRFLKIIPILLLVLFLVSGGRLVMSRHYFSECLKVSAYINGNVVGNINVNNEVEWKSYKEKYDNYIFYRPKNGMLFMPKVTADEVVMDEYGTFYLFYKNDEKFSCDLEMLQNRKNTLFLSSNLDYQKD